MSPRILKTLLPALLSAGLLAGCGGGQRNGNMEARVPPKPAEVPTPPARHLVPIDPAMQSAARQELLDSFASADPQIRAHALEGLRQTTGVAAGPQIMQGLSDNYDVVRYAAAMAAGELKYKEAMPSLRKLIDDPTGQVRIAARFALHRLGDTSRTHDLERTAFDADKMIRSTTATVLGRLGEPSGVKILRRMRIDHDPATRQIAAESLYLLGDPDGLADLVGLSISQRADDQMVGLLGLAQKKNPQVAETVRAGLTADYPEVRLVAARALAMVSPNSGPDSPYDLGYVAVMEGAKSQDKERGMRQRQLAALALGEIRRSDTQETLGKLLKDPEPDVRVAAATAVLQLGKNPRTVNAQEPAQAGAQ